MGFERDYATQDFVREFQGEKSERRKKLLRWFGALVFAGVSLGVATKVIEIAASESGREVKPTSAETTDKILEGKPFEVAKPEETKRAERKKGEGGLSDEKVKIESPEFAQGLIESKYKELNETSDFKITFDINDKNGEVREMIERIGLTYGNPDHINLYKAIAAKESRLKWEHSIDGGIGYFQITNIPPSIEKEVSEIAERDKLSKEEANTLAGIQAFERSLEYVRNQRKQLEQESNKEEEILLATWANNIGPKPLDLAKDFEENYQKFKGEHRNYAPEVMAFERALEEGYRQ